MLIKLNNATNLISEIDIRMFKSFLLFSSSISCVRCIVGEQCASTHSQCCLVCGITLQIVFYFVTSSVSLLTSGMWCGVGPQRSLEAGSRRTLHMVKFSSLFSEAVSDPATLSWFEAALLKEDFEGASNCRQLCSGSPKRPPGAVLEAC